MSHQAVQQRFRTNGIRRPLRHAILLSAIALMTLGVTVHGNGSDGQPTLDPAIADHASGSPLTEQPGAYPFVPADNGSATALPDETSLRDDSVAQDDTATQDEAGPQIDSVPQDGVPDTAALGDGAPQADGVESLQAGGLQAYKIVDNVKADRIGLVYDSVYRSPTQPSRRYLVRVLAPTSRCSLQPAGEPLVIRTTPAGVATVVVRGCFAIPSPVVTSDFLVYLAPNPTGWFSIDSINLLTGVRRTVVPRPSAAIPIASYRVDGNFVFWSERGMTGLAQATLRRTSLVDLTTATLVTFTVNPAPAIGNLEVVGVDATTVFFAHRWGTGAVKFDIDLYRVERTGGAITRIALFRTATIYFFVTDGALAYVDYWARAMFTLPKTGGSARVVGGFPGTNVCSLCGDDVVAGPTGLFFTTIYSEGGYEKVYRLDEAANRIVEVFRRQDVGFSNLGSLQSPARSQSAVAVHFFGTDKIFFTFRFDPRTDDASPDNSVFTVYGMRNDLIILPR